MSQEDNQMGQDGALPDGVERASTAGEARAIDWAMSQEGLLTLAGTGGDMDVMHETAIEAVMELTKRGRQEVEWAVGYTPAGWWFRNHNKKIMELPDWAAEHAHAVHKKIVEAICTKSLTGSCHLTSWYAEIGGYVAAAKRGEQHGWGLVKVWASKSEDPTHAPFRHLMRAVKKHIPPTSELRIARHAAGGWVMAIQDEAGKTTTMQALNEFGDSLTAARMGASLMNNENTRLWTDAGKKEGLAAWKNAAKSSFGAADLCPDMPLRQLKVLLDSLNIDPPQGLKITPVYRLLPKMPTKVFYTIKGLEPAVETELAQAAFETGHTITGDPITVRFGVISDLLGQY